MRKVLLLKIFSSSFCLLFLYFLSSFSAQSLTDDLGLESENEDKEDAEAYEYNDDHYEENVDYNMAMITMKMMIMVFISHGRWFFLLAVFFQIFLKISEWIG